MGSNIVDIIEGDALLSTISITSGTINITYSDFDMEEQPTNEVKFPPIFSLAFISLSSYMVTVYFKRKLRIA